MSQSPEGLGFSVTSILNTQQFSFVFLVDWIMVLILVVFFCAYFDRFVAYLVSKMLVWIVWKRYKVLLEFGSLKLSLLSGRLFFAKLVYIGPNQAFSVLHGSITWRYWLPHVRESEYLQRNNSFEHRQINQMLPSRLHVVLNGLEWFAYNRSPAFDLLAKLQADNQEYYSPSLEVTNNLFLFEKYLLKLLPLHVVFENSSFVIGNSNTESLLVGIFPSGSVIVDMKPASNEFDRYMMCFASHLSKPVVKFVPNPNFEVKNPALETLEAQWANMSYGARLRAFWRSKFSSKRESAAWKGLSRYTQDEGTHKENLEEYARVSTIIECQEMDIDYFYDDVGANEESSYTFSYSTGSGSHSETQYVSKEHHEKADHQFVQNGGPSMASSFPTMDIGATDPLFGVSILVKKAKINYGPWAERQRTQFFNEFYPRQCLDAVPIDCKKTGCLRLVRHFTTFIEFQDTLIWRFPTREPSKDHLAPKRSLKDGEGITRLYGWLDVKSASSSCLSCVVDLLPGPEGWKSAYQFQLQSPEVLTSVNYGVMFTAECHTSSMVYHTPLKWKDTQVLEVVHNSEHSAIFLLREHLCLVCDLKRDFASAAAPEYALFTPFLQKIAWNFDSLSTYMNVNPLNIINKPTSIEDNTFLVFKTPVLNVTLEIPTLEIAPETSPVTTLAHCPELSLALSAPSWHTLDSFMNSNTFAVVKNMEVRIMDTFNVFKDNLADIRRYTVEADSLNLISHGFLIQYLFMIRENYCGSEYHFKTKEEFVSRTRETSQKDPSTEFSFSRIDSDEDIIATFIVRKGIVSFPAHLYSSRNALVLTTTNFTANLRITNYYMDMQADFASIDGVISSEISDLVLLNPDFHDPRAPALQLSEFSTRAHRMFGLPPSEPTYMCKWDFDVGDLAASLSIAQGKILQQVGIAFVHGYLDIDNKPNLEPPPLYDLTLVAAHISKVQVHFQDGDSLFNLAIDNGIKFNFMDLMNQRYTGKITLRIPSVDLNCQYKDEQVLDFSTFVNVTDFIIKPHSEEKRQAQQDHITLHDSLFHRCSFLLDPEHRNSALYKRNTKDRESDIVPKVNMPDLPLQMTREVAVLMNKGVDLFWGHRAYSGKPGSNASDVSLYSNSGCSISTSGSEYSEDSVVHNQSATLRDNDLIPMPWFEGMPGVTSSVVWKPHIEYDNIVVEFGPVKVRMMAKFSRVMDLIADHKVEPSLEAILDDFQFTFDDKFQNLLKETNMRLHLVVPEVNIELFTSKIATNPVFARVERVSFMASVAKQLDEEHDLNIKVPTHFPKSVSVTCTLRATSVMAGISKQTLETSIREEVATVILEEPYVGCTYKDKSLVLDIIHKNCEFALVSDQIPWLQHLIDSLVEDLGPYRSGQVEREPNKLNAYAASLLLIAREGQRYNIESDPNVLTRPYGAVEGDSHIRSHISWRILMRVRHILQSLPAEAVDRIQRELQTQSFVKVSPSSGSSSDTFMSLKEEVIEIFKKWRSWEQFLIHRASVFHVFDPEKPFFIRDIVFHAGVEVKNLACMIRAQGFKDNVISLSNLSAYVASSLGNDTLHQQVYATFSELKATFTANIYQVIADLKQLSPNYQSSKNVSSLSCKSFEKKPLIVRIAVNLAAQQITVNHTFKDLSFMLQQQNIQHFGIIRFECGPSADGVTDKRRSADNTTFFTSLFTSGIVVGNHAGVRVFKDESTELADYLLGSLSVGYSLFLDHKQRANLWSTVSISELSFGLSPTVIELFKLLDMLFKEYLVELSKLTNLNSDSFSSSDATFSSSADISTNLSILVDRVNISLNPVNRINLGFLGEGLNVKIIQAEPHVFLASTMFRKHTLSVNGIPTLSLGTFSVTDCAIIARYDISLGAPDLMLTIGNVDLKTISVLAILDYIKNHNIDKDVQDTGEHLNKFMGPSEPDIIKTSRGQLARLQCSVNKVQFSIPLDSSSFIFTTTGIFLRFRNFAWVPTAQNSSANITEIPVEGLGSWKEFTAVLEHCSSTQQILSLHASGNYRQDRGSNSVMLTSNHFNLRLDPYSVGAMAMAVTKLRNETENLVPIQSHELISSKPSAPQSNDAIWDVVKRVRASLRFRNFRFDWNTHLGGRGGFKLGFDSIQMILQGGKLQMKAKSLYLCPFQSLVSTDFEQTPKSRRQAFIPEVSVSCGLSFTEGEFSVYVQVIGKSFSLDCTPSIAPEIADVVHSFEMTARHLCKLNLTRRCPPQESSRKNASSSSFDVKLPFSIRTHLDEAVFRLWDDLSLEHGEEDKPSLEMHSPALKLLFKYLVSKTEKNQIFFNVNVDSSSNTVFPKALQELKVMCDNIIDLTQKHRKDEMNVEQSCVDIDSGVTLRSSTDSKRGTTEVAQTFLEQTSLTIEIHIAPQVLTMSCQPYSKVTAMGSMGEANFFLSTPSEGSAQYVAFSGIVKDLALSFQHMYTNESTGLFKLQSITIGLNNRLSSLKGVEYPLHICLNVLDPYLELLTVNAQDYALFRSIWSTQSTSSASTGDVAAVSSFATEYIRFLERIPFPVSIQVGIMRVKGLVDAGTALGKFHPDLDRLWLAAFKTQTNDVTLATGIDNLRVRCEGPLHGSFVLSNFGVRLTVGVSSTSRMPLFQLVCMAKLVRIYLGLNFRPSLVASLEGARLCFVNQESDDRTPKTFGCWECTSFIVVCTSLLASQLYGVGQLFNPTLSVLENSGDVNMKDSISSTPPTPISTSSRQRSTWSKLTLSQHLCVKVDLCRIYVFPTDFTESTALWVSFDGISATFKVGLRTNDILVSTLELGASKVALGLASLSNPYKGAITELDEVHFLKFANDNIRAGTITRFPKLRIHMETFQDSDDSQVKFIFTSSIDGFVDVGWNLGSVNMIRKMAESHEQAWESRVSRAVSMGAAKLEGSRPDAKLRPKYIALEPPVIVVPKLHDMGEATPPVEWIGVNRQKLPGAMHWYVIRSLQKGLKSMEIIYDKILAEPET